MFVQLIPSGSSLYIPGKQRKIDPNTKFVLFSLGRKLMERSHDRTKQSDSEEAMQRFDKRYLGDQNTLQISEIHLELAEIERFKVRRSFVKKQGNQALFSTLNFIFFFRTGLFPSQGMKGEQSGLCFVTYRRREPRFLA